MTGEAFRAAWFACLPLALLAVVSALSSSPARAQPPSADPQPQIVYQNPKDGAVLQQLAYGIQLCFASPVNIKDLDKGGDFAFGITEPDGFGLGSRDVFQPDGYGITVYPGNPIGDAAGQWKFHYRLTSPDAQAALEGDINYTVDPTGSPFPQATPPVCVASGGTAMASPTPGLSTMTPPATTPPVVITASPAPIVVITASPAPTTAHTSGSATPTSSAAPAPGTSGNSPDILKYALFTIGAVGAAAGVVLIGLVVRRRAA